MAWMGAAACHIDMGICVPTGVPSVCDVVRHIQVMTHICYQFYKILMTYGKLCFM
jgi:hypothetical protein